MGAIYLQVLNNGFCSKFQGYRVQQRPEEGWRLKWLKRYEHAGSNTNSYNSHFLSNQITETAEFQREISDPQR